MKCPDLIGEAFMLPFVNKSEHDSGPEALTQNPLGFDIDIERSRESEKPLGLFSMVDFVAKLDAEPLARKQPRNQANICSKWAI